MAMGPNTDEEAGAIVSALHEGGVDVVVAGHWSITAFNAENPSPETQAWLEEHSPAGAIDLACPGQDRTAAKSVFRVLGYSLREESDRALRFEDARFYVVNLTLFRWARDSGRIYSESGLAGEDWYYPPESITNGRLGSVRVRTDGPDGLDKARAALASDEQ